MNKIPLYVRIACALVLGLVVGMILPNGSAQYFDIPARLILRLLGAIAPPLILVAVSQALIGAKAGGKLAGKMFLLLILNTTVAIAIGIGVANAIQPGSHVVARPQPNVLESELERKSRRAAEPGPNHLQSHG